MARPKNEAIGTVECPVKGCTESCNVFRFRQRSEGRSRFAGKLYIECTRHGRYGADGKPASQDYILENAKLWGPEEKPVSAVAAPVTAEPPKPAPAPAPTTRAAPVPAPKKPGPDPSKPRPWWLPILD